MAHNFANLTSGQLKDLSRLISQKEKLGAQLAIVIAKLENFPNHSVAGKKRGGARSATGGRGSKKRSKPRKLKAAILTALEAAANGLTIKDLAEKLKVKPNNLYSWFYTTGRKVAGLKKSGDKYVYTGKK